MAIPSPACSSASAASAAARRASDEPGARRQAAISLGEREHDDEIGDEAMVELRRRHVVDDRGGPRRQAEQALGQQLAAHQRPGVVGEAGAQARDQRAEPELNEDQRRERSGGSGEAAAPSLLARRGGPRPTAA